MENIKNIRAKLSDEDRLKFDRDVVAFGKAAAMLQDDGTAVYLPPEQWDEHLKRGVKCSRRAEDF